MVTEVKNYYNIANFAISGEESDVNEEIVNSCAERQRKLTREYELKDIRNLDETAFF